jgi:hypothetical protein
MMTVMPYRVVPELNQFNLMVFLLNWGRGCCGGKGLAEAFCSEFEYEPDNYQRFVTESDVIVTLRHIENLMKEIR